MEDLLVFLGLLFLGSFLFVLVAAIVLLVKTHLQSKRLAGLSLQIQSLNRQVSWLLAQASGQNGLKETAPPPDPAHNYAAQPEPGNAFHFHPAQQPYPNSVFFPQPQSDFHDRTQQTIPVADNPFADYARSLSEDAGSGGHVPAWARSGEIKLVPQNVLRLASQSREEAFQNKGTHAESRAHGPEAFSSYPAWESLGGGSSGASSLWGSLASFVSGGHAWVAGGVLLLFIAFALLLTYMASQGLFTMEMRIAAAALFGLALLTLGWVLRERRAAYSLVLQGGGIGLLYLSVFGATRLTDILGQEAGLVLISLLIPSTIILALRQQSQPLAIFGLLGGFAAPVLLSSDSGNFVALFSYYMLLNTAVLIIGRFRLWRGLNLVAFVSTFGVAIVWVFTRYEPEMFARAEPFMLGFIGLFTLLGIFSAKKRETGLRNFIDMPVVIGAPVAGALIQWEMLSGFAHGLPFACITFSVFYLLLAVTVWKREGASLRSLAEGYLALSVLLANLAVPLELSAKATSAVWAAEAILVFFLGARQGRRRVMWAGLVLNVAASAAFFLRETFLYYSREYVESPLFHYSSFTGSMIIAVSALAVAVLSRNVSIMGEGRNDGAEGAGAGGPSLLSRVLFLWGLCWWFGGWWFEFDRHFGMGFPYFFMMSSFTALAGVLLARRLRFPPFAWVSFAPALLGFIYVAWVLVARTYNVFGYAPLHVLTHDFFAGPGLWAWLFFFAAQAWLLKRSSSCASLSGCRICGRAHAIWLFLSMLVSAAVLTCTGRAYTMFWGLSESWTSLAGILPALAFVSISSVIAAKKETWPSDRRMVMLFWLPLTLVLSTSVWFLGTLFASGDPTPLPQYIPLLNPLELEQAFCIAAVAFWQIYAQRAGGVPSLNRKALFTIMDVMVFLWLTAMLARATHFFMEIPMSEIPQSGHFQLALLVLWGLYGIGHMAAGNKLLLRRVWAAGAILMLIDIGKLLLVDLAQTGTITRIISFFVAGLLLLFIGWAAPLPPASEKRQKEPYEA